MTSQARANFWHQHVINWQTSGFSGQAYCKQQSLTYHQFVYWRKKYADSNQDSELTERPGFAKVAAADHTLPRQEGLSISLPNGMAISGLHGDNIHLLGAILEQL